MCFDVTGMEEYIDFGSMPEPISADELRAKLNSEGNNM